MKSDVAELAAVLALRGADGKLIYSDRDVAFALALLFALERGEPTPAARVHLAQIYRWAGVEDTDSAVEAKLKIDRYLEKEPLHPALLRQLQRILRSGVAALADRKTTVAVGTTWAMAARQTHELDRSRGSVLNFRLEQGRSSK